MSESRLADRIRNGSARVTVIGQGYVGLPLAVEFARAGFNTTGLDTDLDRVIALNAGQSYTPDVDSELLKAVIEAGPSADPPRPAGGGSRRDGEGPDRTPVTSLSRMPASPLETKI